MDASWFELDEMRYRLVALRQQMSDVNVDALLVEDKTNVRYLSGFRGEPAVLLVTPEDSILLTSYRSESLARSQTRTFDVICESKPLRKIASFLGSSQLRIGTDPLISHPRLMGIKRALEAQSVKPVTCLNALRQIKSEAEIGRLKESQRVNEEIFDRVLGLIRPGMTERAVQGLILKEMALAENIEGPAFAPIVATGMSAWEIHHLPNDTRLEPGDMVIIDHGVMVNGYASDMTRCICLGDATGQMKEIHGTVLEAQEAAFQFIADGVRAVDADAVAREIIEAAGHGRGYTHGLGHGIGMETHDAGLRMSPAAGETLLLDAMVLTVEPGIYLENDFGVRMEDTVVVRKDGLLNLTKTPRDLIELEL